MGVGKIGNYSNLLRGVHGAVLGRLRDRDRPRLYVVLVTDVVEMLTNSRDCDFSVRGRNSQELAPDVLFRRPTLRGVYVRRLGADYRLVRAHHASQTQHVRRRPAEDQKNFGVFAELGANPCYGLVRVGVVAVGRHVADIRRCHCREDFGMDTRPVIAGKCASRLLLLPHQPTITSRSLQRQGEESRGSARWLMKVAAGVNELLHLQLAELLPDHVPHAVIALEPSLYHHESRESHHLGILLDELLRDDHVDEAEFVFHQQEHRPFGALRLLPYRYQARRGDSLATFELLQLTRVEHSLFAQLLTQMLHGMAADADADREVVEEDQ